MAEIGLFFEFTYGITHDKAPLTTETPVMKFRPGRYFHGLAMYDASGDLTKLFDRIRSIKGLTFTMPGAPLYFSSHFASAYADQRVLGYAKLSVKQDKMLISPPTPLDFMNYMVTKFEPGGAVEDPILYLITIQAKEVV